MSGVPIEPAILIGLGMLAFASFRMLKRINPKYSRSLKWWQKLLGVVAALLVVFIIINPEFAALGLLGDTAFVDLLVLMLSLHLQSITVQVRRRMDPMLSFLGRLMAPMLSSLRRLLAPRYSYVAFLSIFFAFEGIYSSIQKIVKRIFL
jgi:hypothetical protein